MNRNYILITAIAALFLSCAKEDPIEVHVDDTRYYFEPQPDRTDAEAQLRRAFYEKYDIHLLFSDTLRCDSICQDFNGDTHYFMEMIDMYYNVGNYMNSTVQDVYWCFTTMQQRYKATRYLETEIQPHFSERMRPFSWLLVDKIAERQDSYKKYTYPYAITGERCIAIALNTFFKLPASKVPVYTQQILNTIAVKMAQNNTKALSAFYDYSRSYYGRTFAESSIDAAENLRMLREAGFFTNGQNPFGMSMKGVYPPTESDLGDFVRLSIANTRSEVVEQYAEYPLIIKKDSVVRQLLESRGFIYEPERPTDIVTDRFWKE